MKDNTFLIVITVILFSSLVLIFNPNEKIQNNVLIVTTNTITAFFAYKRGKEND